MKKWLGLLCIVLAIAGGAQAASLDADVLELGEVVVTGARTEQTLEQVPANITVIDEQSIREANAASIPELLRGEEGLVVRDLLGNGKSVQVDLRGFGESGQYNTLVLVDGRRVNQIDLSGVDWTQIPLHQIERIEILRGAGSVLYGDNAVGGVINIITRTPGESFEASAGLQAGSFDRHQGKVSLSQGWAQGGVSLYAGYEDTDGYRENNAFRSADIGGRFVFEPFNSLTLSLSGTHHEDEFGLPGPLSEAQYKEDREQSVFPEDEADTRDSFVDLGLDFDGHIPGSLSLNVSYRETHSESDWELYQFFSEAETETLGLTPKYTWQGDLGGHWNRLTVGADIYRSDLDQETESLGSPAEEADIQRDSLGIYAHNEFSIAPDLILTVGARQEKVSYDLSKKDLSGFLAPLDETDDQSEQAFTAGLSYVYGRNSSLFARANRSIRFPLTDERIEYDFVNGQLKLNQLQPQIGQHVELGVRHWFSPDILGKVSLFRAKIRDEIFFNPQTFSNENHPETLHQGLEAGTRFDFLEQYTLQANYTYTEATFEDDPYDGNRVPAVPEHLFSLRGRIQDLIPGLTLHAAYRYVGSSYAISDQANALQKKDDYFSIDAGLSYERKNWRLFAKVLNLTGEEYAEYVVADWAGLNYYPAPKTNWLAGVEYTF